MSSALVLACCCGCVRYHLSIDDRCKSMFTYTEAIPLVKELVINFPRNMLTQARGQHHPPGTHRHEPPTLEP